VKDSFLPRLVFKFLFRSRSVGVLPWLTVFALVSVAVGVATLILVLSVMNGFSTAIQEQLVDIYSPLRVYPAKARRLNVDDTRKDLSPYLRNSNLTGVFEGEVLLRGTKDNYQGARVLSFTEWQSGRLNVREPTGEGVQIGQGLAQNLYAFPGDEISIIRPNAQQTPFGILPGGRTVRVRDVFRTGYQQLDRYLGIVSWKTARSMFNLPEGQVSYVEIWTEDRYRAVELKEKLAEKFPDKYFFVTWQEASPAMFEALELERTVTFIVLTLIILVAAINILSMLVLSILQRRKQIAMMMAMGASPARILGIFLTAGLSITVSGLLIGTGLGTGIAYLLDNVFIISLPPVYPLTKLPVEISLFHLGMIGGVTLLLGGLSSFYPAWKASQIDPAEVLRYG
jgi:lipoprotein-releasing system permease protein